MHQITYAELAEFVIHKMTKEEQNRPVKVICPIDGELYPEDATEHPEIYWSSKLVKIEEIYANRSGPEEYYDGTYKHQYIILPCLTKEEEREIGILHLEKELLRDDLNEEERIKKEKQLEIFKQGGNYEDIVKFLREN